MSVDVVERGWSACQLHTLSLPRFVVDGRLRGQDGIGGWAKSQMLKSCNCAGLFMAIGDGFVASLKHSQPNKRHPVEPIMFQLDVGWVKRLARPNMQGRYQTTALGRRTNRVGSPSSTRPTVVPTSNVGPPMTHLEAAKPTAVAMLNANALPREVGR